MIGRALSKYYSIVDDVHEAPRAGEFSRLKLLVEGGGAAARWNATFRYVIKKEVQFVRRGARPQCCDWTGARARVILVVI